MPDFIQAQPQPYYSDLESPTPIRLGQGAQSALGIGALPSPLDLGKSGQNAPALLQKKNEAVDAQIRAKELERTAQSKLLTEGIHASQKELQQKLKTGPETEKIPDQIKFTPTDIQQTMGGLLALAALSGLASRQPLTASLNAMAGMIQGVREGDETRFQRSFKEYDQNLKTVLAKNKQYENEFNRIVKSEELSITQKAEELRLLNVQFDRQVAQVAGQKVDYRNMLDLGMKSIKATTDAELKLESIKARAQAAAQASADRRYTADLAAQTRQAAIAARPGAATREPKTEEGKNLWAQMVANGTAPAGGRYMNGEVFDRMAASGVTAQSISTGRAGLKSDQSSLTKATQKSDALHATLNSFHNNIQTWESIAEGEAPKLGGAKIAELGDKMQKLDFSKYTTYNDALIKVKTLTSDPAAAAYITAAMTVAMDYARIMASQGQSAGQIAEGARNEAINLIKAGYNKDARQAMIGVLESDTEGQLKGVTDQQNEILERIARRAATSAPKPVAAAAAASNDPAPPKESRVAGQTKWRGHTWDGTGWVE